MAMAWLFAALALAGLAAAVAALMLARRYRNELAAAGRQLTRQRSENDRLREGFGRIAGWSPEGRLPDDWPKIIQERLTPAASATDALVAQKMAGGDSLLGAAREILASVSPPVAAAGDRPEHANETHSRVIELLEGLEREPKPLLSALANGDLDRLFGYWVRLEVYFPDADQTVPYALVAAVLILKLKSEGVRVQVPRPLSVAGGREDADFTTEDLEGLRRNNVVRARAAEAHFLQASDERLVVDCISPGWSGAAGGRLPRLLIWDRSWQD